MPEHPWSGTPETAPCAAPPAGSATRVSAPERACRRQAPGSWASPAGLLATAYPIRRPARRHRCWRSPSGRNDAKRTRRILDGSPARTAGAGAFEQLPPQPRARHLFNVPAGFDSVLFSHHVEVLRVPKIVEECRRSEEHTSELQSPCNLVCRLLLE